MYLQSFLLAVEDKDNGNAIFGIPAMRNINNTGSIAKVNKRFFWKIGNPIESYNYIDVDKYVINGHISYMRQFENGIIIVNPYNITDFNITLNKSYINPENNDIVQNNINLEGYSALMLLKE